MRGSRVSRYEPKPGEEIPKKGNGVGGGWRAAPYKPGYYTEATIDPRTIGYPATPDEMNTFMKKQAKRFQETGNTEGLLTQHEVDQILKSRAKRQRQAQR